MSPLRKYSIKIFHIFQNIPYIQMLNVSPQTFLNLLLWGLFGKLPDVTAWTGSRKSAHNASKSTKTDYLQCKFSTYECCMYKFWIMHVWIFHLGKLSFKKNGKKRGHCPLWAIPPPKRVKRGHFLSDYRQNCVNATRDILMSKARKMTILTITMFIENVHTGCLFFTGTP